MFNKLSSFISRVSLLGFLLVMNSNNVSANIFENNPIFSWIGDIFTAQTQPLWIWRVLFFIIAYFLFQAILHFTLLNNNPLRDAQSKAANGIVLTLALGSSLVIPIEPVVNMFIAGGALVQLFFYAGMVALILFLAFKTFNALQSVALPESLRIVLMIVVAVFVLTLFNYFKAFYETDWTRAFGGG